MRSVSYRIAEPMMQVPGRSAGDSPPATPKLMTPVAPSAMALDSEAAKFLPLPLQMTWTPGPAAMRASNAKPTTAIKRSPDSIAPPNVIHFLSAPAHFSVPARARPDHRRSISRAKPRGPRLIGEFAVSPVYGSRRIFRKSAIRFPRPTFTCQVFDYGG